MNRSTSGASGLSLWSKRTPAAESKARSIRQASWERSCGRSKACSSAPFRAMSDRPSFWLGSTNAMHFWDAAKYVTEIDQPFIFSMAFLSKKWFDALPTDLQTIVDADATKAAIEVNPWQVEFYNKARQTWAEHGELIRLPENEQVEL